MRKPMLFVLLAALALAPALRAQAPRRSYDADRHDQDHRGDGYTDHDGRWHGYPEWNEGWHGRDYGRAAGPDSWTFNEGGHHDSLPVAAHNYASVANTIYQAALRRAAHGDRAAFDALHRLDDRAQNLDRAVQQRRGNEAIGKAYADVVAAFLDVQRRFGALGPDAWLSNEFHVMASNLGRVDHRFFGDRGFGGNNPGDFSYGYERLGYDRYGHALPGEHHDRGGHDGRPPG